MTDAPTVRYADVSNWMHAHGILLQPHQLAAVYEIVQSPTLIAFLMRGRGSGRTFTLQAMERYFDETRRP